MSRFVQITGLADVNAALVEIPQKEAINLLRGTVTDVTKMFGDQVEENAPEDDGDLKGSVKSNRARVDKRAGVITGRVSIEEPGRSYWHFPEFGSGPDGKEQAYILRAFQERKGEVEQVYVQKFADRLVKSMARKAKKAGKAASGGG